MSDFQQLPNTGSLKVSTNKTHPKSPDFWGSIAIDKDLLIELVKNRTSELIEIKLSAWKKVSAAGNHYLSLSIDTYKKPEQQTQEKDPWL